MHTPSPEQHLAAFLAHVSLGYSQRQASRACHVSRRTVWLRCRSSPTFAADLVRAELAGRAVRAEEREDDFRERWAALALEAEEREKKRGKIVFTRKAKRFWYRWRGYWMDSQLCRGNDPLSKLVTKTILDKQQRDFAAKRRQLGKPPRAEPKPAPAEPAPAPRREREAEPPRKTGRAGVLW